MSVIKQVFPGWYVDALPGGGYAYLIPEQHLVTSHGTVPLPGQNVLFVVCANWNGTFVIAGQGHADGKCLLWNGTEWLSPCSTYGTSPCAFGPLGLYVSTGPAVEVFDPLTGASVYKVVQPIGARGIAAVDATGIHSVDGWYAQHNLAEFVDLGGIYVGQDFTDGCAINGRLLEPGNVQFIRAHREGDNLSVALWKPKEARAVCFWLTVADIDSLPVVVAPLPQPPTPETPAPTPEPPPMRTIPIPDRFRAIVQALYERNLSLAEGDDDQRRALILKIAQQARYELGPQWGAKDAGGGRPMSKDAIGYLDGATVFVADCFNGSTRKPSVPAVLEEAVGQHFIAVEPVDHLAVKDPQPVPLPQPTPDVDLKAAIAGLESQLEAQSIAIIELIHRVTALEQKPTPGVVLPKLRVRGNTSRDWGHGHRVDLEVVPE